jgi:NAD(P)-dependent dehydrogenase (short-subunit alcohol dehydrogenase family)
MAKRFEGKTVAITGGNSGIGLATAKLFRAEGARVAIAGRDQKTLDEAAKSIGGDTLAVKADVSKLADIDKFFTQVAAKFGKIDALFANAGIAKFAPAGDSSEQLFDETFDINVKGLYFTLQKALSHLNDNAGIVLNSSVVNSKGTATASVYAATKAAVRSLARTFASELVDRGIRVNVVRPRANYHAYLGTDRAAPGRSGRVREPRQSARSHETIRHSRRSGPRRSLPGKSRGFLYYGRGPQRVMADWGKSNLVQQRPS